jgi:hypothetical protein
MPSQAARSSSATACCASFTPRSSTVVGQRKPRSAGSGSWSSCVQRPRLSRLTNGWRQGCASAFANCGRAVAHVRGSYVPCVDGSELARLFFTFAGWSVQPCVRPVCAVHMTAGHNAFRGSGPGQKPAFDNALALVGCPDRRIGRLCITCCSPSQPSHHAGCRRDLGHAASATGSL